MKKAILITLSLALAAFTPWTPAFAEDPLTTEPVSPPEPVSYVTVDAGTPVELALDEENQVVEATPLEETPAPTPDADSLIGQPVGDAVDQLVDEAVADGTLPADGSVPVVVDVVSETPEAAEEITDDITDSLEDPADGTLPPAPVVYSNAAQERIAMALELGITPGKLNLIQKYAASTGDPESVVIADWTGKSVKEIMKAIKENRKAAEAEVTDPADGTEPVVDPAADPVEVEATDDSVEKKDSEEKKDHGNGNGGGKKGGNGNGGGKKK